MNVIIGDGRNWQYTEDTRSPFKTFCGIYQLNLISLIFLQLMHKMTRKTTDIIFSWLQNLITPVCVNLVYISLTVN